MRMPMIMDYAAEILAFAANARPRPISVKDKQLQIENRINCISSVAFLIATFLLCSQLIGPTLAKDEAPADPQQAVSVVPQADDAQIATRLERILKSTEWFTNPHVTVRDGVVTLDGKTTTAEHQEWAGTLAEKTEGTVAVVNRIVTEADVVSTFGRAGNEFSRFGLQVLQSWPMVVLSCIILIVAALVSLLVSSLSRRFLGPTIESPLLLSVVSRAIAIPIFLLGIYFVLKTAGLTSLALTVLGGTGILGIVVGFAFRDIAENFLASILLSIRNPFRSGDLIEVAGHTGIVQNLNTRTSVLLTLDGNHVQIPNATVYKNTIKNFSSTPNRRADFTIGIGYEVSTAKAQSIIAHVLEEHPAVLENPKPLVLVDSLGSSAVNLKIFYWFDSQTYSPAKINSALLRLAMKALAVEGLGLTATTQEVIVRNGDPIASLREKPAAPSEFEKSPMSDMETLDVTAGEGDLSSEADELAEHWEPDDVEGDLLKHRRS